MAAPVDESTKTDLDVISDEPQDMTNEERDLKKYLEAETDWKTRYDADWEHEHIVYKNDYLAVRTPLLQALAGYQLASGKYSTDERRNDAMGLFVDMHLGRESYDRLMQRLMDPDDPEYTMGAIGDVMSALIKLSIDKINADKDEKKALDKGK